jgi:tetratricopeptide (TPR) repeat protein
MFKIVMIVCFLFISFNGFAQEVQEDSLLTKLHEYKKQDTTKLKMLLEASYQYAFQKPAKGLALADSAFLLSNKLHDSAFLSSSYYNRALNRSYLGDDSAAIQDYNQCILIRKALKDSMGMAKAYHNLGIVYYNLSDYPHALNYQQSALKIFQKSVFLRGIGATQNSIGVIYLSLSSYSAALQYFLKAKDIYEKQHDSLNLSETYTNIGLIYSHMENYDKALEYFFTALQILKNKNEVYRVYNVIANIGSTYDYLRNTAKSLEYYNRALSICRQMNNRQQIAQTLFNIGTTFYNSQQFDSAFAYIKMAIPGSEKVGDYNLLANEYQTLSGIYLYAPSKILSAIGIQPSQRLYAALQTNKKSVAFAEKGDNLINQQEAWDNLSTIYTSQKNYAGALDAYKKYIVLRDSVMNQDKKVEITRIAMQYEFDKQQQLQKDAEDKRLALAASDLDKERLIRKRNALAGLAVVLFGAVILAIYLKKRNADFRSKVANTELKALRSQMNPHFIFNSLNSINNYISKNEPGKATEYLAKFAKVMRLTLENSEKKSIPLSEELKALELYMELESKRLDNKFDYTIKVDPEIDIDNTLMPPMILQPFVENSIWHGLAGKKEKGNIFIGISKNNDMLRCVIDDDGIGIPRHEPIADEKRSFGMQITKARIDIINKSKKSKGTVELSSLARGVRVQLNLPLELSF